MDDKDRRIAELETALAEKTRQWEAAKRIAVEQGHHRILREQAEAENAMLRQALVALGGEQAVADALRGPGHVAPEVPSEPEAATPRFG
ncbi:hypothetical protein AX289_27990 [Methylorubrum populi]|nr:hypothetical protein AX289_27990 [Methylorubrum populi]